MEDDDIDCVDSSFGIVIVIVVMVCFDRHPPFVLVDVTIPMAVLPKNRLYHYSWSLTKKKKKKKKEDDCHPYGFCCFCVYCYYY